ncbi:uncharacterized protein LOC130567514 [Triplophysa rosa]|uniref:uncharacterized protein LOC130567514 n=1 Tax=Triplophysa rosa TaxID=992332 RepID=UPI0025460202|nr:uncharacterized protein LOC130567514 [Triplophysa rosa]
MQKSRPRLSYEAARLSTLQPAPRSAEAKHRLTTNTLLQRLHTLQFSPPSRTSQVDCREPKAGPHQPGSPFQPKDEQSRTLWTLCFAPFQSSSAEVLSAADGCRQTGPSSWLSIRPARAIRHLGATRPVVVRSPPKAFGESRPHPGPWPAVPQLTTSVRLPPLATQALASGLPTLPQAHGQPLPGHGPYYFPIAPALEAAASVRLPPRAGPAAAIPSLLSLIQARPHFSLATSAALPVPLNAPAMEPPPVSSSIRTQILAEVQAVGARRKPPANTCTSIFGADLPINHPLKNLLDASLNSIIQAVSPRTLQSYLTAWKSFKSFHQIYNLPFPEFSLLAITSFISYLNTIKNFQASSIKGYLSGINFFHKLIFNSPSQAIASPQASMLIKGIQRAQPAQPDARQPITIEILTKCITTLRRGYHSIHTAHTLDAMFILAFFGFLRCSEISTTSSVNPKVDPTVSDLSVLDSETISYFLKQSKMDQTRKGYTIYIFNLQSQIQPYQTLLAYLQFRKSQAKSPSDPLFVDDSNRPDTPFWFQKHLKSVLLQSSIPAGHFSSHSFRIGAATTAAQKGLSQSQIQALGRWTSEAFKSYIRSDRTLIREAHRTLITRIF